MVRCQVEISALGMRRVAFVVGLLLVPLLSAAQTPSSPTTEDCFLCHSDSAATRGNGTSIAVAPDAFGKSIHGQMACVDCHADLATTTEFPHPEKLQKVSCATCHDEPVQMHARSVHAQAPKGATCVSCHGAHDILPSSDAASRTHALNLPKTCSTCHTGGHLLGPAGEVGTEYRDSVHGRAIERSGLVVSANCGSCHGSHDIRRRNDPESKVNRVNIAATCATCHQGIQQMYARSVHAQQISQGNPGAAVCSDCHTSHRIQRTETDAWRLAVIEECGTCHVEKIATYRDTYHGKVTELGFTRVAGCSSCHGSHTILPASHPESRIAPQNRVATCRQCHSEANENFAKYDPHADKNDPERSPVLYWTNRFMQTLLFGVILFFGAHTLLWFPRSYKARRERDQARSSEGDHA
jgi:nitrate/TMAO reductase-like tetraheme cytochrome c subunit